MDEQILNSVNQKLDRIIEQGRNFIDEIDEEELRRQLGTGSTQLRGFIRRYPISSVVVGLAAGLLCSRLFRKQ